MSKSPSVPVAVLLRACTALRAAKDSPVGTHLPVTTWGDIVRSHSEIKYYLDLILADQAAPVSDTA